MFVKEPVNTNVYYSVKPLHCVAQLVGLAPYCYIRNPQTGEELIDISRSSNVKKIIWALVLLFTQFIGIIWYTADNFINPPNSLVDFVEDTIQFPFFAATSMTAMMLALTTNRSKMLQIVKHLNVTDNLLFHNPNNIYKQQHKQLLIILLCVTVSSIILFYFDVYYYLTYNPLYVIVIYVPYFIWSINELQFLNVVEMLKLRLTTLNGNISMFSAKEYSIGNVSSNFVYMRRRHTRNRYASNIDSSVNTEECMGKTLQISNHESIRTSHILKLSEIYNRLYEMCSLLNSMYGYMLLQQFSAYIMCLVVDGYILVRLLIDLYKADDPLIPREGYTALLLWNVSNVVRPFVVCLSCQRLKNEYKRTVYYVQTIKLHPDMSREISNQLKLFANQIKHCKLEFSACDFFDINLSLFCSVILTATTYITVLVLLES
ncbi:hypothetical protein L798_12330 [Zootermopsis nevadensis]|uniref:Gustatory receptor n=1 Tax=Zootermopsis nevadensis TaxID=136037 RepID=A0A067QWN3_ZOONE|nr:hypothetical protein L798_12330 [Zootermopsis nevadensis]